ncbi:MAG: ribosome small subunit-dependent GTPase A, partial [Chloroflexota bacterium]
REERQKNKAKKQQRRVKQERKPRRRDWIDYADGGEDEIEHFERIMPANENDRRREVEDLMKREPESEHPDDAMPLVDMPHPRVVEVSSGMCRVDVEGDVLLCTVRGSLKAEETGYTNVLTVGDHVIVTDKGDDTGLVEEVLPRRNIIARPDPSGMPVQQLIAANLDQLLIVAAWRNPQIWFELVDRYLITAERNHIKPIICVNKVDLADDENEVNDALKPYRDMGYDVVLTSAATGAGIKTLRLHLHNKVSVVAGLSGVGKSSLLSAVQPGFQLKTGDVNEERGQGRHTTTQSSMMPFGSGGYVVDTPGIREFGLAGLQPNDLLAYYPDVLAFAMRCKFTDCTHTHEPDCAVRAAVGTGALSATRYHSYTNILASLE